MSRILRITGLEILDSRGRPTVKAECEFDSGARGEASVPAGASTGRAEAVELRDADPARYHGLGCRKAALGISQELNAHLAGQTFPSQAELDRALIAVDGTPDKSRLGANALLAVSLAFARAVARERGIPLYEHLAKIAGTAVPPARLPRPTINLFSGGKHAGGQVPIQDVLVVPLSAGTITDAMAMTFSVYQSAAELCFRKYGMRPLTADEGGLAPSFPSVAAMLDDAVTSISHAGLTPGEDIALAIDLAASHFHHDGWYHLSDRPLAGGAMIDELARWCDTYPIVSLEDGLAEEDWEHWTRLRERLGARVLIVGDDLLCTNPRRIAKAVAARAANALLLKVNQVGTLSEAAEACALARQSGWSVTVSARSGETEDNWLADLAVGWAGDQIKVGSITHSERLAKYNRLLEIERETGLPLAAWPDASGLKT